MTSIGAIFIPQQPPERLYDVVRAAEESGLDELWLWEDCFFESGIASVASALAWTERLRVGVGLLPVPLRNVALTAMEIATLNRMFPGRSRVGIGHGVQTWMRQTGEAVESPLTLLREYLTALRGLLRAETVTTNGRYVSLDDVALAWPPAPAPPVFAGAAGPRSLRLCAELADGVILDDAAGPGQVADVRRMIEEVRPNPDQVPITVYLLAATGPRGAADAIADAVAERVDAGAERVVLQPAPADPEPEAFVRFVAEQVRPRVP